MNDEVRIPLFPETHNDKLTSGVLILTADRKVQTDVNSQFVQTAPHLAV